MTNAESKPMREQRGEQTRTRLRLAGFCVGYASLFSDRPVRRAVYVGSNPTPGQKSGLRPTSLAKFLSDTI